VGRVVRVIERNGILWRVRVRVSESESESEDE
jgi:hypothetical protein